MSRPSSRALEGIRLRAPSEAPRRRSRALGRALLAALALAEAFLSAGCNDNVACVFIDGCTGGGGAIAENEAVRPVDGESIVDGPPEVAEVFPSGNQSAGTTPVVLVFSETMQGDTLQRAFEIVPEGENQPIPGVADFLVSDGRVLVLLTGMEALEPGDYVVRLAEDAVPLDLTGQALELEELAELGTFTVAMSPPASPRIVTSFPEHRAANQSATTEIVVVFDRPVVESSVTPVSFDVRVNDAQPVNDPPAKPLSIGGGRSDTRVYLYRSLDADGQPASLGTGAEVDVVLSPGSNPIEEMDGNGIVPATTLTFDTLPFAPPLRASLLSRPSDAIGLANLTDGDPEELMLEVELLDGEPNESIDLFLFGIQKTTEKEKPLIALQRQVRLSGTAPIQSVIFTREDIGIQRSSAPDDAHFEDDSVTFAFRARRGSAMTPVKLLDLDPDPDTIQDLLLDTDRPTIEALEGSTGTGTFRSDQRDLALIGRADEDLASVEVTTQMGTNGPLAPVVGTTPTGTEEDEDHLFLAAPVALGLVDGGSATYSAVARDEALNQSPVIGGTFTQLGSIGAGAFAPGDSIDVEVFDSRTLQALSGALVLVHSDHGNGAFPFFDSDTTGTDGRATLATEGAPSTGAIVTVELDDYDLFTLHGVPRTRLSVPLRHTGLPPARAGGLMATRDSGAVAFLKGLDQRFDDSRRPAELPRGFPSVSCDEAGGVLTCTHAPVEVLAGHPGAQSFYAGEFLQTQAGFQESQLLRAFAMAVPLASLAAGGVGAAQIEVEFLLDDPSTPPEERIDPVPPFVFEVASDSGVDLAMLVSDPMTRTGAPFVTVESLVPGLGGALAVAQGVAFDGPAAGMWTVRAVQPGAVTPEGSLGSEGRVDPDPFVRVEVIDVAQNAVGVRPRVSGIAAGIPVLRALAVPTQLAPAAATSSGGQAFVLRLRHAIGDERSETGLYRVELADELGRGWTLWRFDEAGTGDVQIRVVDVAAAGGVGFQDGDVDSVTAAYASSAFLRADFLWSDVEREFELFSRAAPLTFAKP